MALLNSCCCHTETWVNAIPTLSSCAVHRKGRKQCSRMHCSRFVAKQDSFKVRYPGFPANHKQAALPGGLSWPAVCTSFIAWRRCCAHWHPLLSVLWCSKLRWHTLHMTYLSTAKVRVTWQDYDLHFPWTPTADCISPLLPVCPSEFGVVNEP